jgi:hypothetical protein
MSWWEELAKWLAEKPGRSVSLESSKHGTYLAELDDIRHDQGPVVAVARRMTLEEAVLDGIAKFKKHEGVTT